MICSDKAKHTLHTKKLLVAHSPHCHCLCSAGQIVGSPLCAQEQTAARLACYSSPWTGSVWEEWASSGNFQAKQKNVECWSSPCLAQAAIPRGLDTKIPPPGYSLETTDLSQASPFTVQGIYDYYCSK